jgi:hypothetical protein
MKKISSKKIIIIAFLVLILGVAMVHADLLSRALNTVAGGYGIVANTTETIDVLDSNRLMVISNNNKTIFAPTKTQQEIDDFCDNAPDIECCAVSGGTVNCGTTPTTTGCNWTGWLWYGRCRYYTAGTLDVPATGWYQSYANYCTDDGCECDCADVVWGTTVDANRVCSTTGGWSSGGAAFKFLTCSGAGDDLGSDTASWGPWVDQGDGWCVRSCSIGKICGSDPSDQTELVKLCSEI